MCPYFGPFHMSVFAHGISAVQDPSSCNVCLWTLVFSLQLKCHFFMVFQITSQRVSFFLFSVVVIHLP